MTLTDFLLARIAEDEAVARAAMGRPSYDHFGDTAAEETLEMALNEGCAPEGARHFRHWMPARVLAECEAKRRVVELIDAEWSVLSDVDMFTEWVAARRDVHEQILKLLALPYADHHPDYDQSWRP